MAPNIIEDQILLVITTERNIINAKKMGKCILENKLAACISFTEISSMYRWQNELNETSEIQLIVKTTSVLEKQLLSLIEKIHSYSLPELICVKGSAAKEYLSWVLDAVS